MTDRRPRARPLPPQERRAAIVAAALPLVVRHGAAVTTRQVAEAAGIAEGTIFRVFPDKLALVRAVAEDTMNPPSGRAELSAAVASIPDLHGKVVEAARRMMERTEQVVQVMVALRGLHLAGAHAHGRAPREARGDRPGHGDGPPGPPAFIAEAQAVLLDNLTDLVFAPHAEQLRVPPAQAALVLRSLVFGLEGPGHHRGDRPFTAEQIADVVLHGLVTPAHRRAEES